MNFTEGQSKGLFETLGEDSPSDCPEVGFVLLCHSLPHKLTLNITINIQMTINSHFTSLFVIKLVNYMS